MRQVLTGALMLAAVAALVYFTGKAHSEERNIFAVMCDTPNELEAVYAIHGAEPDTGFDAIMTQVKAKLGSDNCLAVTAHVNTVEVVKSIKADDGTMLEMWKVRVERACQRSVCFAFPNGNPAYVLLMARDGMI